MRETTVDESLRARITELLANPQVEGCAMKQLWEEVQRQPAYKSPEEKLSLLLDFREYCTAEEWESCRQKAFAILDKSGFRAAREYAVEMHNEFRERAKKREQEIEEKQS